MTIAEAASSAALAAFAALPTEKRAAILAGLQEGKRSILLGADWLPPNDRAMHAAFEGALACVTARYHGIDIPFGELIQDHDPARVIWALSELLVGSLRRLPESAVADVLRQWGTRAANGLAASGPCLDTEKS